MKLEAMSRRGQPAQRDTGACQVVYRQVTFSIEAFDRLKDWQRHWQSLEGRRVTNGVALDRLILAASNPPAH